MKNKLMLGFLIILLVGLVFSSGCIEQKEAVCGNGKVEAGEECDGDSCPSGQVCKVCQCVAPTDVPSPPPLPE